MPPIKPVELARQLDVSTSTLRRWAGEFSEHLSKSASASDTRRRYTARDVAVLKRAQQLLDAGNTVTAVNDLLRLDDFPTEEADQAETAPMGDQTTTTALISLIGGQVVSAQADQAQRLTQQDAVIHELRRDLEAVQRALDHALARLEALEGKVGSVGDSMHRHTGPVQWFTRGE